MLPTRISFLVLFLALVQSAFAFYAPLVERQSDCITCPVNPPPCPTCNDGELCQITSQNCTQCAQSLCIQASSVGNLSGATPTNPASGPNVGAIAGGIVAAVAVIGCVAGGVFWYVRKRKRVASHDMDIWLDKQNGSTDDENSMNHDPSIHPSMKSSHQSVASTAMSHASVPIMFNGTPMRNTMMSAYSSSTSPSNLSHPPTQFFSADDILRASLATNHRDTQYSDTESMYTYNKRDTSYTNRDSVGTSYTRASMATRASIATNAYRSTAIITAAPPVVAVRAQPKMITIGSKSAQTSPIPAVPELTAEKVAAAERARAGNLPESSSQARKSHVGLGLDIPITIQADSPRLSAISTMSGPQSPTMPSHPIIISPIQVRKPSSPVLREIRPTTRSVTSTPKSPLSPPIIIQDEDESSDDESIFHPTPPFDNANGDRRGI